MDRVASQNAPSQRIPACLCPLLLDIVVVAVVVVVGVVVVGVVVVVLVVVVVVVDVVVVVGSMCYCSHHMKEKFPSPYTVLLVVWNRQRWHHLWIYSLSDRPS